MAVKSMIVVRKTGSGTDSTSFHHRDAEFAEFRNFLVKFFTRRSRRLGGVISDKRNEKTGSEANFLAFTVLRPGDLDFFDR